MKTIPFYARGWESDSYLVINGSDAVLIDAGVAVKTVLETLERENAALKYILLTHGHFDHTITADGIREATGAGLIIHADDSEMLSDPEKSALATFFGRYDTVAPCDMTVKDGDTVAFGDHEIKVIHTPGHSKGSVCYLVGNSLFTGDTLFNGGYGRYDLYGGDLDALCASLSALKKLDGSLEIYPGHGDGTTLKKAINYLNFI